MTQQPPRLADLDTVPWRRLRHVRGPADDTPLRLRALLAPDQQTREPALRTLEDTLCHQDDQISEASLAAVPFLFELIAWPEMPQRGELLDLLICITYGNGWFQAAAELSAIHQAFDRSSIHRHLNQEGTLPARINAVIAERQDRIAALLDDADVDIAFGAFQLVEALPRREPILRAALDRCLERDDAPDIRAAAAAAVAASDDPHAIARLRDRLPREPGPLARLALTIGLLLHHQPVDASALDLALDAVAGRSAQLLSDYNQLPCSLGAAALFAVIAERYPAAARARLDALIDACSREVYLADYEAAGLLYLATAGQGARLAPGEPLPEQRRAIETVACATWAGHPFERIRGESPVPRLQQVLRAFELPDDINGLRERLGYPPQADALPASGR